MIGRLCGAWILGAFFVLLIKQTLVWVPAGDDRAWLAGLFLGFVIAATIAIFNMEAPDA